MLVLSYIVYRGVLSFLTVRTGIAGKIWGPRIEEAWIKGDIVSRAHIASLCTDSDFLEVATGQEPVRRGLDQSMYAGDTVLHIASFVV